jgi:hypothetical protein
MAELNGDGYLNLKAHFWGNLDESGVLANEGVIRVIGAEDRQKHEVAVDDNSKSLSTVCIGSSAGNEGPLFVLAKGKKLDSPALVKQMKEMSPPHSRIIMTPSAYMTDAAWLDLVPDLCKGIRAMPVVCQHPDWWFTLLFDGFGSHLGTEALKIFAEYKIQCTKEEGDSLDTNQAYNQLVAKADKRILREYLDKACGRIGGIINQKVMIGLVIRSLSQVPSKTWVESFAAVNLHPDRRIPFEE